MLIPLSPVGRGDGLFGHTVPTVGLVLDCDPLEPPLGGAGNAGLITGQPILDNWLVLPRGHGQRGRERDLSLPTSLSTWEAWGCWQGSCA